MCQASHIQEAHTEGTAYYCGVWWSPMHALFTRATVCIRLEEAQSIQSTQIMQAGRQEEEGVRTTSA